jgi:FtsP/CotA-like multicopper oxidase with cupredoxin domain
MNLAAALRITLPLPDSRAAAPDGTRRAPLFAVKRGRAVVLALANSGDASIPVHIHGHAFRLLDRLDDGWKPFWLDTIPVAPSETTRVAFIADNPGRWLIEGGAAAVAWFDVTDRER